MVIIWVRWLDCLQRADLLAYWQGQAWSMRPFGRQNGTWVQIGEVVAIPTLKGVMLMPTNLLKIDVSEKVMSRLSSSARASDREERELVEEAIAEYLDRQDLELAAVEEGMVAAAKNGLISHEAMTTWLLSWGTDNELPPPEPDIARK